MRLAPSISTKVNSLLNASEKDIVEQIKLRAEKGMSTARLDGLLKSIQAARSKAWKEVKKEWAGKMLELSKSEPEFLDRTLTTVSPATLDITLPNASTLGSIAKETPFEGRTMSDWANRVEASDMSRIEQSIKIGLSQGQSSQDIARRIVGSVQMKGMDGVTQITRNNANAITRTAVNAISNAAKQEFYKENAELFSGEMFLATLDARTTLVCASNDNKQFKVGEGPVPPLHWQCRSLRLAVINGQVIGERPMRNFTKESLEREYAEQGSKGSWTEFKKRRMRELTGTAPASLSYNEWLKGQSPAFQDDILGPARGKMFREQGLTLDKFVNRNGDALNLKQLQKIDEQGLIDRGTPPAPPRPIPKPDVDQMEKDLAARKEAKRLADIELDQEVEAEFEKQQQELAAKEAEIKRLKDLEQQERKRAEIAAKEAKRLADIELAAKEAEIKRLKDLETKRLKDLADKDAEIKRLKEAKRLADIELEKQIEAEMEAEINGKPETSYERWRRLKDELEATPKADRANRNRLNAEIRKAQEDLDREWAEKAKIKRAEEGKLLVEKRGKALAKPHYNLQQLLDNHETTLEINGPAVNAHKDAVYNGLKKAGLGQGNANLPTLKNMQMTNSHRKLTDREIWDLNELEPNNGGVYLSGRNSLRATYDSTALSKFRANYDALAESKKAIAKIPFNVSEVATNTLQKIENIVIHEYGHHVHIGQINNVASDIIIQKTYNKAIKAKSGFVSEYATYDHKEFWAESFNAYHSYPRAWMVKHSPDALKMVEEVLDLVGIPLVPGA